MEKQTIDIKVNHSLEWHDDIIEIAKMQKDYAIMCRVETEDEYKERVLAEKAQQEAVKNRELAELKRLKQKYE